MENILRPLKASKNWLNNLDYKMLQIIKEKRFNKDIEKVKKRGYDLKKLLEIVLSRTGTHSDLFS